MLIQRFWKSQNNNIVCRDEVLAVIHKKLTSVLDILTQVLICVGNSPFRSFYRSYKQGQWRLLRMNHLTHSLSKFIWKTKYVLDNTLKAYYIKRVGDTSTKISKIYAMHMNALQGCFLFFFHRIHFTNWCLSQIEKIFVREFAINISR